MGHFPGLSQAGECLICNGPCKDPMRFTLVLGRDRMHDLTEHEDDAVIDPNLTPVGKRGRR